MKQLFFDSREQSLEFALGCIQEAQRQAIRLHDLPKGKTVEGLSEELISCFEVKFDLPLPIAEILVHITIYFVSEAKGFKHGYTQERLSQLRKDLRRYCLNGTVQNAPTQSTGQRTLGGVRT